MREIRCFTTGITDGGNILPVVKLLAMNKLILWEHAMPPDRVLHLAWSHAFGPLLGGDELSLFDVADGCGLPHSCTFGGFLALSLSPVHTLGLLFLGN
jgi:hypothetical protein